MTRQRSEDGIELMVVVGTRPEIIKTAPVIRAIQSMDGVQPYLVHTNQHYDHELSDVFFDTLGLPQPDTKLHVESGSHAEQTAAGLTDIERLLEQRDTEVVLAQGDTNAVFSTALAASKLPVAFAHVEAGLRSGDRSMPEEINRVVADHVADYRFAPTEESVANLTAEGIADGVYVTGNTIVDACLEHQPIAEEASDVLREMDLRSDGYAVATIHRPQNTDDLERLHRVLVSLDRQKFPVILPAHPRTAARIRDLEFEPGNALRISAPLDYLNFLKLLGNARVAVTDSGGIQEEASILEIPCLTVRPNTERPETTDAGVNELIEPEDIETDLSTVYVDDEIHDSMKGHPNLYGDGTAGKRIVDILLDQLTSTVEKRAMAHPKADYA